jgi:hypothetical protein
MPVRPESSAYLSRYALSRRCRILQLRIPRFKVTQLAHKRVVLAIRHGRRIAHIVTVVMLLNFVAQLFDARRGIVIVVG